MDIGRLAHLYLQDLAPLPTYLAVLFFLFAILAYGFACVSRRALITSWRGFREVILPTHIYQCPTVRFDIPMFWLQVLVVLPAATYIGALYTAERFAGALHAAFGAPALAIDPGHVIAASLVQIVAAQILGTFGAFVYHYAGHKLPAFWAIHKVHHSAEALSPFTAVRGHPLDTLFAAAVGLAWRSLVVGVALYFTGGVFTPIALAVFAGSAVASLVQDSLNHSHVPLSYGWFDRFWVGPLFHQIHHSTEPRHRDKNFGGGVPLWDWLFGTFYLPDPRETFAVGLNEAEYGAANPHNSFRGYMIEPAIEFAAELGRLARRLGEAVGGPFRGASAVGRRTVPRV